MSISTDTARPSRTGTMDKQQFISSLEQAWKAGSRWKGVTRPYTAGDVYRLGARIDIESPLAGYGAARLWQLFQDDDYVAVLSAVTGNQAIQQVQAGLKAIYVSGWQVAADANNALEMYPDQSLYPSDSVPALLRRLNNAQARRRDRAHEGRPRDLLVRPAGGGRRSGIRRTAARLRDHEEHDRRRRRRGALRGSARIGEEVRASGRQGARADERVHHEAGGGAPGNGRVRRGHDPDRPHRREQRHAAHERLRRVRPALPDRRADRRGGFPRARRRGRRHRAGARLRTICRFALVRNVEAGSRGSDEVRRSDPRQVPGQVARVQLLAVVQLAQAPERGADRRIPEGAGCPELQVPVRDAVRVPCAEPQHVRAGAGVQGQGDGRLLGATKSRVRVGKGRLRGGAAPGVRRRRVLRRDHSGRDRRAIVGDRDGGLDGATAVPRAVA